MNGEEILFELHELSKKKEVSQNALNQLVIKSVASLHQKLDIHLEIDEERQKEVSKKNDEILSHLSIINGDISILKSKVKDVCENPAIVAGTFVKKQPKFTKFLVVLSFLLFVLLSNGVLLRIIFISFGIDSEITDILFPP